MMYEIVIRPTLNGFTAKVGCQTLVYESIDSLLKDLGRYLNDPEGTELYFREHALNARHTLGPVPVGAPVNDPLESIGRYIYTTPPQTPTPNVRWGDCDASQPSVTYGGTRYPGQTA